MEDVIARLRQSKRKSRDKLYAMGHDLGMGWAKHEAEAGELVNLEVARDNDRDWEDRFDEELLNMSYGPGETFVFLIRPEDDGVRPLAVNFWESIFGDDHRLIVDERMGSGRFVLGFADGALSVWDKVKDQL